MRVADNSKTTGNGWQFPGRSLRERGRPGELEARLLGLCLKEMDVVPLCIVPSSADWGEVILYFFASVPNFLTYSLEKVSLTVFFFCSFGPSHCNSHCEYLILSRWERFLPGQKEITHMVIILKKGREDLGFQASGRQTQNRCLCSWKDRIMLFDISFYLPLSLNNEYS